MGIDAVQCLHQLLAFLRLGQGKQVVDVLTRLQQVQQQHLSLAVTVTHAVIRRPFQAAMDTTFPPRKPTQPPPLSLLKALGLSRFHSMT